MGKQVSIIICLLSALFITSNAYALLENNGDGTINQTRNDGSVLMWLQDANYAKTSLYDTTGEMTWVESLSWITHLNSVNYIGYSNWRLPNTLPINGSTYDYDETFAGTTDKGYGIRSPNSEMSYLYYVELGNYGTCPSGTCDPYGGGLNNTGPFENIVTNHYWSSNEYDPNTGMAWNFDYANGLQTAFDKNNGAYSWAVRTVVPEPISSILFVTGGILLAGRRLIRKRT